MKTCQNAPPFRPPARRAGGFTFKADLHDGLSKFILWPERRIRVMVTPEMMREKAMDLFANDIY